MKRSSIVVNVMVCCSSLLIGCGPKVSSDAKKHAEVESQGVAAAGAVAGAGEEIAVAGAGVGAGAGQFAQVDALADAAPAAAKPEAAVPVPVEAPVEAAAQAPAEAEQAARTDKPVQIAPVAPKWTCQAEGLSELGREILSYRGDCLGNKAQGFGVLVVLSKDPQEEAATRWFFGEFDQGKPVAGVLQLVPGKRVVGRVVAGKLSASCEPDEATCSEGQLVAKAYSVAQKAAQAASREHRSAGNSAISDYYAKLAKQLLPMEAVK